mgnify:CR=1 FL=1
MTKARDMADIVGGGFAIPSTSLGNAVPADGSITSAKLAVDAITPSALPDELVVSDTSPQLGATLDTNGHAIQFGTSAWTIELDTGDNDLLFKYNGTAVYKLASNGAVTSANNMTAFGSV